MDHAQRARLAAAGGAALAVLAVLLPLRGAIAARRTAIAELRERIAATESAAARQPAQQARLRELEAQYQEMVGRADQRSIAHVLEGLSAQAKAGRLELATIQPRTDVQSPRTVAVSPDLVLREFPVTLQLTGQYQQIGEFIGGLHSAPLLASVRRLAITKTDDGRQLRATLDLAIFLTERAGS